MLYIMNEKIVKTRKPHSCHGCSTSYPAKSKMKCLQLHDDEHLSIYFCETCTVLYDEKYDIETDNGYDRTQYIKQDNLQRWKQLHDFHSTVIG